ncbi:MAG: PolC-type DNA polymerase III [Clostridia bacterium]|nr:PolC-type DNA polymerase III [Clostridia bacterium]
MDFKGLFGNYISDGTDEAFSTVTVKGCDLDMSGRILSISLESGNYISEEQKSLFKSEVEKSLKLNSADVNISFDKSAFCIKAIEDIVNRLRKRNVSLNGYFNGAVYSINGDNIDMRLKYGGYKKIHDCGFEKSFIKQVAEAFGFTPEIAFSGQLDDVEIKMKSEPAKQKKPEATKTAVKDNKSQEPEEAYNYKPKDGLPVYLESAKRFFGRKINTAVTPLKNIMPPANPDERVDISAWGEVSNLEVRDVNTRRGGRMVTYKFNFSDGTNTFCANLKKFFDPKYVDNADNEILRFKKSLEKLKDSAALIVNGDYGFDNWSNGFVVEVKALAEVKKYQKTDEHSGLKRVELHCHTNMSAKDAVSSAGDLINTAYLWGHKAIAITDHGVVQAYPAAAAAVKKIRKGGNDFKVIYGVESYFIDDIRHDITSLSSKEISRIRNHQIILVKNKNGLKNLYRLVSGAHLNCFHSRPITLRSELDKYREGLIIGSACEQGELYRAVVDGKSHDELIEIAKYYDYLEIQPIGNNEFMVRESSLPDKVDKKGNTVKNRFKNVTSIEVIKDFNRKIVEIADELSLPVVATGDVHFLREEDGVLRQIVLAGQGFDDIEYQAPLYFKTTDEMLSDFSYFGERAKEFVIDNPNKIADMVSGDVIPVPEGNYPPTIEGSDDLLKSICWDNAHRIYGERLPEIVEKRLDKELNSIISNGFSIMYISAQKLVAYSEEKGYLVGSRGSVGSSFVATMAGISEVNPLPAHYVCPNCHHSEFFGSDQYGSGFDLPEKNCPECGMPLGRDGHNIPFETFLGFKGDKVPDIDLNFSDEVQNDVQEYTKTLFGAENVFKAGTITTIAEKTAFGFVKAYAEKTGITISNPELNRLAKAVENSKVKMTTGQHPAGMIIVPGGMTIYDFCPVQHPADDVNSDIITTHFDFHSIHDTILKLDELGHVVPTTYKYLEEYSGIPVNDVSMSDKRVMNLFISTDELGVSPEDINSKTGTLGLPEFGTKLTRDMLIDCKPKTFADLLQISGLSHGTNVWHGNAKTLIDDGTCTISEVIGTRDNIMVYLIQKGMDESRAFKITETVRKGLYAKNKISEEEWNSMADDMRALGVPEWYIQSCKKIEYMFPKAHAAAYVISALKIGWYKVYKPLEYYCAYFTARPEDVDVDTLLKGHSAVKALIADTAAKGKEASKKELDVYNNLLIFNEMMSRGIGVLPVDLKRSHAMKFLPEDGKMRLPFGAISGVGEKAAYSIYEAAQKGDYISKEDFAASAGVSKTIIEKLGELGALSGLPDTNQMSLF